MADSNTDLLQSKPTPTTVIYHKLVCEQTVAAFLQKEHDAKIYFADSQDHETCFGGIKLQSCLTGELVVTGAYASSAHLAAFIKKHGEGHLHVTVLVHSTDVVALFAKLYKDVPHCTVVELSSYVASQDPPELITHMSKPHRNEDEEFIVRGFLFKFVGAGDTVSALRNNMDADIDELRAAGRQVASINAYNASVLVALRGIKVTIGGMDARLVCASDLPAAPFTIEASRETGVGVSFRYDTAAVETHIGVVTDEARVMFLALRDAPIKPAFAPIHATGIATATANVDRSADLKQIFILWKALQNGEHTEASFDELISALVRVWVLTKRTPAGQEETLLSNIRILKDVWDETMRRCDQAYVSTAFNACITVVDTNRALFDAWVATKCGGGCLDDMGATLPGYVTPPAAGSELFDIFPVAAE